MPFRRVGRFAGALVWVSAAGGLAGCMVGPNFHTPAAPAVEGYTPTPLPARTASAGRGDARGGDISQRFAQGAPVEGRWWTLFGSPRLDAFEDEALKANADLASAQAALKQARELYLAQRAALFPTVELAANAVRAHNSETIAPLLANNAQSYGLYTAQFDIAYVPDVFGGVRRQIESTAAQADNQRFLTQAVYLTLTVNVANAVIQLASLDSQMDETLGVIEADRRTLEVTQRQQRIGEASTADVAAAQTTLEQARQLAPPLQRQIDQQRDLLATLLGRGPSLAPADRPRINDLSLPVELPVSLPSELVRQRPDVRAAEANLHAASAQVGVATAARLPSFLISAVPGGASTRIDTLFSNGNAFWSVGGGVAQTLFDAGALRHRQRAAEAAFDQSKAQYRSAVLTALQNTADVLQAIVDDAEALKHADAAATAAGRSLRLARNAFEYGQVGILPVLGAEAADRQARLTLSQARGARYADTVALFQALGGGWRDKA
ncbi:MAG: zneC [Caulobacteraceae bacterium]|nr:zneC [Caulobacteraceae bacterium]